MDVINKFRSTVTSTMSQLSTVLPGNPVTREYEATKHIASAGVGVYFISIEFIVFINVCCRNIKGPSSVIYCPLRTFIFREIF